MTQQRDKSESGTKIILNSVLILSAKIFDASSWLLLFVITGESNLFLIVNKIKRNINQSQSNKLCTASIILLLFIFLLAIIYVGFGVAKNKGVIGIADPTSTGL